MFSKPFCAVAVVAASLMFMPASAQAQHHHHGGHKSGGTDMAALSLGPWSLSYQYMHMYMNGMRDGTDDIGVDYLANVQGYEMVPLDMSMDMHMFEAGYQVNDWLGLRLGTSYNRYDMDSLHFGMHLHHSQHETNGWGDTAVNADMRVAPDITVSMGVSLPTGSIDESGFHGNPAIRHTYDMQLGTGTYDLLPGIAYHTQNGAFDYGAGVSGRFHIGENKHDYSWGDSVAVSGQAGYTISEWLRVKGGVDASFAGDINGVDRAVTLDMPGGNPNFYGGTIVETSLGIDLTPVPTPGSNHTFGINLSLPVYQDLNGPQMKRDWGLTAGWSVKF